MPAPTPGAPPGLSPGCAAAPGREQDSPAWALLSAVRQCREVGPEGLEMHGPCPCVPRCVPALQPFRTLALCLGDSFLGLQGAWLQRDKLRPGGKSWPPTSTPPPRDSGVFCAGGSGEASDCLRDSGQLPHLTVNSLTSRPGSCQAEVANANEVSQQPRTPEGWSQISVPAFRERMG